MIFFQVIDYDGDVAGIISIDVNQESFARLVTQHNAESHEIFRMVLKEFERHDAHSQDEDVKYFPDLDYFVEWLLKQKQIVAKRVVPIDIPL